jgi:hypothetical protein
MNPLKSIFGRKGQKNVDPQPKPETKIEPEKAVEKPLKKLEKKEETFAPKSIKKVTRGVDGKFVSKTPSVKKVTQVKKTVAKTETIPQKKETVPQQTTPNYQTLTFYGKNVRKTYHDNSWYFALEDILPIAAIDYPDSFLKELQEKESVKSILDKIIVQVKFSNENSTKTVSCISHEGFMTLLPIVRDSGHTFLGPFPDWLKDVSKLAP